MFPMSRIGDWISKNTEPSAVIATRWKQLSFWIGPRKILEFNPMLPVDQFEHQLRDYGVGYLVALLDRSRLREFETQMALSSRFSFTPVHRVGNAVILKVGAFHGEEETPKAPASGKPFSIVSAGLTNRSICFSIRAAKHGRRPP